MPLQFGAISVPAGAVMAPGTPSALKCPVRYAGDYFSLLAGFLVLICAGRFNAVSTARSSRSARQRTAARIK